jgi:hypothetical protein
MANWKKVIVSGSAAELLNITASAASIITLNVTAGSGSFSGSFSGNGANLTNVPASGIVLQPLSQSTGIVPFNYVGSGSATVAVSGAAQLSNNILTKWDSGAGKFVDSSLTDTGTVVSGVSSIQLTGASSRLSGSFSGSFQGDGSGLTGVPASGIVLAPLTAGAGIVPFTYSGSVAQSIAISASGVTNAMLVNSTITLAAGTNGSGGPDPVALGETLTINGTNNEIDVVVGSNALTIGLPQDVTISRDLIVSRNLTVQGTASFQNTTNLDVADRFILMASGSNTPGDGGIVIQQGVQGIGEAFGYDNANTRWGVTGSFDGSQATFTPDAFMAAAVIGTGTNPTAAPARYQVAGNIFVGTDESIYIYS